MTAVSYIGEYDGRGLKVTLGRFQFVVLVGAKLRETPDSLDTDMDQSGRQP